MSLLDPLERRFGRFAPTNITLYLIIGQVFVTLAAILGRLDLRQLVLLPALVVEGEIWRALTFLFLPPIDFRSTLGLVLLPFTWWLMYLMWNALEHYWGAFRYNTFLLFGYLFTVAAAFITPVSLATNIYFLLAISLAFAWLNPDFELLLFFILPVKIKWIAAFTLLGYAYKMIVGTMSVRWMIIASLANLLLFFGRDIVDTMRSRRRNMAVQARRVAEERKDREPRHRCCICGKTDLTNPEMDFRYCSKCAGDQCYCPEHIFNHAHVVEAEEAKE